MPIVEVTIQGTTPATEPSGDKFKKRMLTIRHLDDSGIVLRIGPSPENTYEGILMRLPLTATQRPNDIQHQGTTEAGGSPRDLRVKFHAQGELEVCIGPPVGGGWAINIFIRDLVIALDVLGLDSHNWLPW